MSVIVDFSLPATDFLLGELLDEVPDARVRLERVIPLGETVAPFFWVRTAHPDAVLEAISGDPHVEDVSLVETVENEFLFAVEWGTSVDDLCRAFVDADATVLDGRGSGDAWTLQVRFPDHDRLATFHDALNDDDVDVEFRRIHDDDRPDGQGLDRSLTDTQRETLRRAVEKGYFSIPREITLGELADELGVSDTAVSQRLRRGIETVLGVALSLEDEE